MEANPGGFLWRILFQKQNVYKSFEDEYVYQNIHLKE